MKVYVIVLAAFLFFTTTSHASHSNPLLVIDNDPSTSLPKRFRIMTKDGLQAIGSGQFSPSQLIHIKNKIDAPIIIIDLRQESHGFVNDWPISWYGIKNWENKDKPVSLIQSEQRNLLANLAQQSSLTVYEILEKQASGEIKDTKPLKLKPKHVYTEQQLANKLGLGYKRFYVTDHAPPTNAQLNEFKRFLKTVPKNTWLYFHCRGGSGRTTTFMALYDIIQNGKKASLPEILQYQQNIGGKNLAQLPPKTDYKYPLALKRLNLIKKIMS